MRQHDEFDAPEAENEMLERAVDELRRPLRVNASLFDARVMDEVLRTPSGARERLESLLRPLTFRVSPLLALAAGMLFAVSIAGSILYVLPSRGGGVQSARVAQGEIVRAASGSPLVQFGFVA